MKSHFLLLAVTALISLFFEPVSAKIEFKDVRGNIVVKCDADEDIVINGHASKSQTVTDPFSGTVHCEKGESVADKGFLHLNLCKNCVVMDIAGISGMVIASVTFTIFIAIAVYSVSAPDRSWSHQASDRHPLMHNDASDAIYSHLDNSGKSMYSELGRRR
ncbi:T-cell surface glycoprotein CD3 delta chain-like [Scyliorhinus canicula]|uniref:T-cell surface glycoprotein CD3 delta chain-like n=1 Tax=Scyliorhinus canicula TaxID=7830 RepID=UPI0018F5836F|nr:T-cell surface glycoprotein CD3 delta chain-like [Scyliorhinus canicula]XP_038635607.1 T-cell surface glycoprotein CD3 delta chain-like [Scyliorhinus canicula]